ncbi:MAG: glycosyltransferase [Methylococcales bacterium]
MSDADKEVGKKPIKVSIIIKALNEQDNIERCLVSCIKAIDGVVGEVILADSLSEDDTVSIASRFPVKVVQLLNRADRGCGVAAQLGYQIAQGEYIYIIDGDMELPREFLLAALNVLDTESAIAGVGGQLEELNPNSHIARVRASRNKPGHQMVGVVDRLDGGGLFRRAAIVQAGGYITHCSLHAYEELELALRLRQAGWKLIRLDLVSMRHAAHTDRPLAFLARRWRSRYAFGSGELMRAALGKPYLWQVLYEFRLNITVCIWWTLILSGVIANPWRPGLWAIAAALFVLPFVVMILRKRSLLFGVYAVLSWNVFSAGMLRGLFGQLNDPRREIPSRILVASSRDVAPP